MILFDEEEVIYNCLDMIQEDKDAQFIIFGKSAYLFQSRIRTNHTQFVK